VLQVSAEATRPLPGGTEVDKVLESITGQTLQMTGADLVVLALPGEGHRQLDMQPQNTRFGRRRQAGQIDCDLA